MGFIEGFSRFLSHTGGDLTTAGGPTVISNQIPALEEGHYHTKDGSRVAGKAVLNDFRQRHPDGVMRTVVGTPGKRTEIQAINGEITKPTLVREVFINPNTGNISDTLTEADPQKKNSVVYLEEHASRLLRL